jgi:translocator protein
VLALVGFVGFCLLIGAAEAAITSSALRTWYLSLARPPGTPAPILFAPLWAALSGVVGTAAWLVWRRSGTARPLRLWGWQLAAYALWIPAFFGLRSPLLGLAVLLVVAALLVATMQSFARVQRLAAWLLIPYLLWTGYAIYLEIGFCWLNPV